MHGRSARPAAGARRARLGLLLTLAALCAGAAPANFSALGRRAASAGSEALEGLASELVQQARAAHAPAALEAACEAYGSLVGRAREISAAARPLAALLRAGASLDQVLGAQRQALETAAGEDEAALERLYRSEGWQRLGYATATLSYWRGWAHLAATRGQSAGAERHANLEAARSAFARSARALALPRLASASLLGLGLTLDELGDLDGAWAALSRLDAQLEAGGGYADPSLATPTRRALARVALHRGDPAQAAEMVARIPREQLSGQERTELAELEAEAALAALQAGSGDAHRAAASLRALAAQGGDAARRASALAAQHWDALRGQDLGPVGEILAADDAFEAGRYAEAAGLYRAVLARPAAIPGLDTSLVRLRYAISLAQTDSAAAAADELERLLTPGTSEPVRRQAALRLYPLAEQELSREPSQAHRARVRRAARWLLKTAPDSPLADRARLQLARGSEAANPKTALATLAMVDPSSEAYPAALMDRVRLRAAELERQAEQGKVSPAPAAELMSDLQAVQRLVSDGRLELDARQLATLAVLRARAGRWAGEARPRVLARIAEARALPSLSEPEQRALLRVELEALVDAGDFAALERLLGSRSDDELRRDWPVWYEALVRLDLRGAPPGVRVAWSARLAPLGPPDQRAALSLRYAQALLAAGEASQAATRAAPLVEAQPDWGDAWLLLARAREASGEPAAAAEAWARVVDGVEAGSSLWLEASLGHARAALASDDGRGMACQELADLAERRASLSARQARELDQLMASCP